MNGKYSALIAALFIVLAGCPKPASSPSSAPETPRFFEDVRPGQGPWRVEQTGGENSYQKIYVHEQYEAMLAATFTRIDEPINIDLTNPENQKLLAEAALGGFCKSIGAKCLVESADMAWIVGNPLQYIYVRFRAEKPRLPIMRGLVYYRLDRPFQSMYLLLSEEKYYDNFENVFLNYLSQVKFYPERIG